MTTLAKHLSLVTTFALPAWSAGPGPDDDVFAAAVEAGYEGLQVFLPEQAHRAAAFGMTATAISPARTTAEVEALAAVWADGGAQSLTLHLGTGFETADEARALVDAMLAAQQRHGVSLLVETHRATLTQDPARTLWLVAEYPELRFTADLSHWYTGVELVYGDWQAKVGALAPVFERCRMIHGRISDPGCIQVAVAEEDVSGDAPAHVRHFREMWAAIAAGCATAPDAPGTLPFVVELLPPGAHYARTVVRDGKREEEVDRWTQADVLWRVAATATAAAQVRA